MVRDERTSLMVSPRNRRQRLLQEREASRERLEESLVELQEAVNDVLPELPSLPSVREEAEERPFELVLGAFAVGVAAAMLTRL